MAVRKTADQIKDEILDSLKEEPLSIEQLRKKVESNWSTTSNYLEVLKKEGKVKEIISADKAKIYQRIFGDTYFDVPITDLERKRFRTLFSLIKKAYLKKNMVLTKTHFAKTAVHVIKKSEELSDLPTIWYLYGMIPLMAVDPTQEYFEEISFKEKNEINNLIEIYINANHKKSSKQLQKDQHFEYQEELYILSDNFLDLIAEKWDDKKILELLNKIYIACPIDPEFPEVFDFTDRLNSTINKLFLLGKLKEATREVMLTFNALWKYIATYKAYKSLIELNRFKNNKIILDFNVGTLLAARKICFEESFQELYLIYWNSLDKDIKFEYSEDVQKIREIMQDWTGED